MYIIYTYMAVYSHSDHLCFRSVTGKPKLWPCYHRNGFQKFHIWKLDGWTYYPFLKTIKPNTQRVNFSLEQQLCYKVKKLKKKRKKRIISNCWGSCRSTPNAKWRELLYNHHQMRIDRMLYLKCLMASYNFWYNLTGMPSVYLCVPAEVN